MKLRIATRRSALALAQTRMIIADLQRAHAGLEVDEVHIVTEGDRVQDRALSAIGGKGLFIKELEVALLEGRADAAVHSMKDLPANLAPGLAIVAVPPRETAWDLLATVDGRGLTDLRHGARVGTSSLRRQIQLSRARPDLAIGLLRGNIDTRVRRLHAGDFDAIVLAEAGVRRLGLDVRGVRLDGVLVPAIAQGALALEARVDDADVRACLAVLHHEPTSLATRAERRVMHALGGSCTVPMGAIATHVAAGHLAMRGFFAHDDGTGIVFADDEGPASDPEAVGTRLAAKLRP